jgi:cytochrome c oxidase assembly factor CtaG
VRVSGDGTHPRIEWLADPLVLAPLATLAIVYVLRFRAARREAGPRAASPAQAAAFAGGMLALLIALCSPLDGLGENYLFSAHMLQHVLLGDIAPRCTTPRSNTRSCISPSICRSFSPAPSSGGR